MPNISNRMYHILAFLTASIWGTTFVSTKVLIEEGISPAEIFFIRFAIAYGMMWIMDPHFHKPRCWKDELLFAAMGAMGGSIYFLTENTALKVTLASNVSLIVTTAPLITAIFAHLMIKGERLNKHLWGGAAIALLGVFLVVFNGQFVLQLNPLGDILSLLAAVSWALYSVLLKRLDSKYPMRVITRRVFFYGIVTLLPWFLYEPFEVDIALLTSPVVLINILFLGLIASSGCYLVWNMAMKHIGAIKTNNYIYFIPVVTLLTSALVLNEELTPLAIVGALLILCGVYWAEKD